MKQIFNFIFLTVVVVALSWQCGKEYSFEQGQVSSGHLLKDANGNCLPYLVRGVFVVGTQLNDTDFIEATVSVTRSGSYVIKTDTINGYSFAANGNFSDTGSFSVKLNAHGKPLTSGINVFTVTYDSSICQVAIQVKDSGTITNPAAYTLQGSPGACMNSVLSGGYVNDVTLDTSDHVTISLDVTTPGSYLITTDTLNGYYFSGAGTLTATGTQQVVLMANGTPLQPGTDVFTVHGGGTSCTFSVTVLTPIAVTNNDHFPLTTLSRWVYDDLQSSQDSVVRQVLDSTITQGGFQYEIMNEQNRLLIPVYYAFRKTGSNYFQYDKVDFYTGSFKYSPSIYDDIPFLKENLNTGDSWESQQFSGTASFGQVILLKYIFNCLDANATVVAGGKAFSNVYIITLRPQIAAQGYGFNYTGETYTFYFAKGVGLVYEKEKNLNENSPLLQIRNWLVN